MKKRVILLNLLMLAVVAVLGYKLKTDWEQQERSQNVDDFLKKLPKPTPPKIEIPEIKIPKPAFQPADIVFIGKIGRQQIVDKVDKKYEGLMKKGYVESDYPIETRIILVGEKTPLYDKDLIGTGYLKGADSSTMAYSDMNNVKSRAFDDYCNRATNVILDYYHLVKVPVRSDVVKTVNKASDMLSFMR